jgi:hypothetical protein
MNVDQVPSSVYDACIVLIYVHFKKKSDQHIQHEYSIEEIYK